ncbi:hypothetical protein [Solitalea lacus]|uniref:hypothetical protein n=1 Tax=Solitalea lacus TaxID=2911172 RepID=UPI001EDB1425|nr:hypothetical protein [Solitalea lacus]UKJ09161.1 hypothetical protein L2B55_08385 [Solitalea lacus]
MVHEHYTVKDFLTDDSFINYCFKTNESDITFWNEWIENHPEKQNEFNEAKALFSSIAIQLSEDEKRKEFQKLQREIHKINSRSINRHQARIKPSNIYKKIIAVVSIAIFIMGGLWLLLNFIIPQHFNVINKY